MLGVQIPRMHFMHARVVRLRCPVAMLSLLITTYVPSIEDIQLITDWPCWQAMG